MVNHISPDIGCYIRLYNKCLLTIAGCIAEVAVSSQVETNAASITAIIYKLIYWETFLFNNSNSGEKTIPILLIVCCGRATVGRGEATVLE